MPLRPAYIEIDTYDAPSISVSLRKNVLSTISISSSYKIILDSTYKYTWKIIVDNDTEIRVNFEEIYILSINVNRVKICITMTEYEAKHMFNSLQCNIKDIEHHSSIHYIGAAIEVV